MKCGSYTCQILLKIEFSRRIFKKRKRCWNKKFSENPSKDSHSVQPFLKSKTSPIQSAFYSNFAGTKISLQCSQLSHCLYSETHESLSHPSTYFFRMYSSIILQSQSVLRDLPHYGIMSRILNGHFIYIYIYHKCRLFRPPSFCTLIIRQCTFYYALLYVLFSSFPL